MKSEVFQKTPTPTQKLPEDLQLIANLAELPKICEALPSIASRYEEAPNRQAESAALEGMRTMFPLDTKEFNALLRVSTFLLREMGENDSAEDIADDLATLRLVGAEEINRLMPLINGLVHEWKQNFRDVQLAYATQHAVLPVPADVSTVVDLRAVVPKRFTPGDDARTYSPVVAKLVPIAITRIRFDDDESVVFQMDYRTLRILAAAFLAAEKEMKELTVFVGEEKVHSGRTEQ